MKRVLFVIPSMTVGGAERVFLHLVNHVDRSRFTPLLAVGTAEEGWLDKVRSDVPVHILGARRARGVVPALVSLVRTLKPDTILSTLGFNLAVTAGRPFFARRTRVILREGSTLSAFLADSARKSRVASAMTRLAVRSLYRFADRIVCQSDFMLGDLAATAGLPRGKMVRIYNPVDLDAIARSVAGAPSLYEGPGPHLLTVGRLSFEKAYPVLIAAFAAILREHPSATLTLLGDGDERPALEALIDELGVRGSVRLPGFVAETAPYYAQADLFVSSSLYEGFSNVMIESLAAGTPVVATDCPSGNREVIEEGVNGWFARPNDVESLSGTILRALAARPRLDRASLQQQCAARFSLPGIVGQYEDIL